MSKIREAAERWLRDYPEQVAPCTATEVGLAGYEAGYRAAIAAIREGGPAAYVAPSGELYAPAFFDEYKDCVPGSAGYFLISQLEPSYKLPEDLL